MRYVADISAAEAKLKWNPRIRIEDGLEKSVEWYKKNVDIVTEDL